MEITDIETRFIVNKHPKQEGKFLLYEKEVAKKGRSVHKYLCVINIKDKLFFVDGFEPTDSLEILEKQVINYVNSLPYDSDYYCPTFISGLTEKLIIHDYLKSIGFENPIYSLDTELYTLEDKNIYNFKSFNIQLTIRGIEPWNYYKDNKFNLPNEIKVKLDCGDSSWIETSVKRDVESIKEGIDSLLKPLYLTDSVHNLKKSEELKNNKDIDLLLKGLTNNLEFVSIDYKATLKQKLTEVLQTLN